MNIQIIKADKEDLEFFVTLRMRTMNAYLAYEKIYLTDREHLESVKNNFECAHLILFEENKVGLLKYKQRQAALEIMQFQVSPDFQSKGIGQWILDYMKKLAKSLDKNLILNVLKANPAIMLYLRNGFQIVGVDEIEYHLELKHS